MAILCEVDWPGIDLLKIIRVTGKISLFHTGKFNNIYAQMHGFVPPDPQDGVSKIRYAVIYAPRAKRHRFSANCVEIVHSAEQATAAAATGSSRRPAKVLGPSKSSEGQFIYYLIEWLSH